jgi:alkylated DNA repair dioxygenase AlkB
MLRIAESADKIDFSFRSNLDFLHLCKYDSKNKRILILEMTTPSPYETLIDVDGAFVLVIRGWLGKEQADKVLNDVSAVTVNQYPITMYGKVVNQPRLNYACGDVTDGKSHRYSGGTIPMNEWIPSLKEVRDRIAKESELQPDSCLVNGYRNGMDYIGFHSDKETNDQHSTVYTVSLGATRKFVFQRKSDGYEIEIYLHHTDLVLMTGNTQKLWKHGIPKQKEITEPRYSLTFRVLGLNVQSQP